MKNVNRCLRYALSIMLCAVLVLSLGTVHTAGNEIISTEEMTLPWQDKIEDELWEVMATMSDTDLVDVVLWKKSAATKEKINTALRTEKQMDPDVYESEERFNTEVVPAIVSNLSVATASASGSAVLTSEAVNDAIYDAQKEYSQAKIQISRREYTAANNEYVSKYVDTENRKVTFFSNLTSILIVQSTKADIIKYAKTDEVLSLSYFVNGVQQTDELDEIDQFEQIFADSTVGTKSSRYNSGTGYTGRGVTIGILEAKGGYFDASHPQLSSIYGTGADAQLRFVNNAGTNGSAVSLGDTSSHATKVTALIVGQSITIGGVTYEGVAPDAKVIQTPVRYSNDVCRGIERLAEQGCQVINYSGGLANGEGYSSAYDRVVDAIITEHDIVFVVSAGNLCDYPDTDQFNPNSVYISSPGKAVNAITVGNASTAVEGGVGFNAPYRMLSSSSYQEDDTYVPNKPDIAAPGAKIPIVKTSYDPLNPPTPPDVRVNYCNGTSYSAPIVTGIIAQMMEANSDLKSVSNIHYVKSILLASAEHHKIDPDRDNTLQEGHCIDDALVGNYLREVSGAGIVNAVSAVNIAKGLNSATNYLILTDAAQQAQQDIGTLTAGEKVRIVMTFQKQYMDDNDPEISTTNPLDNINISLHKVFGSEVDNSMSNINNVEIIEYFVPMNGGGAYRYSIDIADMYSDEVPVYVTWVKWRPGDVNGDGATTSLDASWINQYAAEMIALTPEQLKIADVNMDCIVNSLDASQILQYDSFIDQNW